jgi:tRNA threonylcarbamoyladenosine modification (KEOPS) complex  Pcc1 subunit
MVASQGSTFSRTVMWLDPAKKPIHMNGYTARMQVRTSVDSDTVVIELSTENGRITLGNTDGTVNLRIAAEDMINIPSAQYVYDLELVAPVSNDVYKLINGNFVVRTEVTR